jgi:hypothetical protein
MSFYFFLLRILFNFVKKDQNVKKKTKIKIKNQKMSTS